jgi:hypothetical protein
MKGFYVFVTNNKLLNIYACWLTIMDKGKVILVLN